MKGPYDKLLEGDEPASEEKDKICKAEERLAAFLTPRGFEPIETEKTSESSAKIKAAEELAATYGEAAQTHAQVAAAPQPADSAAPFALGADKTETGEPAEAPMAPRTALRWRSIGPTRMDNGQTYGDTRISVAGRVSCVAVDPQNANHILCGSAAGGVFRSLNGGATWRSVTDFAPTLTTGAIEFDPNNPRIVYVGTGEGNFYRRLGQGVLRSTNRGASFNQIAAAPFVGTGFHALKVNPNDSNNLVAATRRGLYVSTDRGVNWRRRRAAATWDVTVSARGNQVEMLAACSDGIYRSTNSGTTWTAVGLPRSFSNYTRLAVDHAPSDSRFAYAFGVSGSTARLWRRVASGAWQIIGLPSTLRINQAWYDWFLGASPDRTTQVYIGAIEAYRGDRQRNGSWRWTRISNKPGQDIHPDQHAIAFSPTNANTVYIGNDGGLYRSPDRGTSWFSLNNGLPITEIEYIAQDPGDARWLLAGTQDNGSIRYTGHRVWEHVADGDGGDCAVNRINPDICHHSYYNMGMERSTRKGGWGTYSWVGPNVPSGYSSLFYPPMESNGSTIAQAGQSVFISRNNGTNWIERDLPGNDLATALYMPTGNRVFVGTRSGNIYRIDWTGSTWSAPNALTSPRSAWISDLYVHPRNLNRIWATMTTPGGGRAFLSNNGGSTWADRTSNLPNLPINAVIVDASNANRVWVAADLGVYQSWNAGASWSVFGVGLPNVLVADLLFHPHARLLRAGTRNRGVWEIPVDGEQTRPICGRQWTGSIGPNRTRRWFTHSWPATWHVLWSVMPTTVRSGGPQLSCKVQVEKANAEHVTYWISVTNHTNQTTRFEGRYCILSRY
jgi:photosystem II stability/assembly factor-like uncharacterized protein